MNNSLRRPQHAATADSVNTSLHIRPMSLSDIGDGLRLCRSSSWNQVQEDWRFFIDSPDGGGRIAEKNGAVAGTVTFLRYEPSFSWLAMMLVAPNERRTGVGSQLVEAALDALEGENCVRLDATSFGEPLYRCYGFIPEYELVRAVGMVAAARFAPPPTYVRPMEPRDFPDVFACDRRIFGADRSALLTSFYQRAPALAWVVRDGLIAQGPPLARRFCALSNAVLGYCFGRPGYLYEQLGPIVAESAEIGQSLAVRCLLTQKSKRVAIDVPVFAVEWIRWLESAGFGIERRFLRMRRGESGSPGLPDPQFAIAGPEFG